MNKTSNLRNLVKLTAAVFLLSTAIAGCSPKPSEQETVGGTSDEAPVLVNDEYSYDSFIVNEKIAADKKWGPWCYSPAPGAQKGGDTSPNVGNYEIRLGVTKTIKLDSKGRLLVRIGLPQDLPEMDTTEVYKSLFVTPSEVGVYARITPSATDFIVEEEPQIVLVNPGGQTSASFRLTPTKLGQFSVSAKVEFFSTTDFSLIVSPKWTNTLSVDVIVNTAERKANRIEELWNTIWNGFKEGFKKFWEAFVALFFAALLFVIRKFIKKKTGYSEIPDETLTQENPSTLEIPTQDAPSTIEEEELGKEDEQAIEPETPSTEIKEVSESDDDDYDD